RMYEYDSAGRVNKEMTKNLYGGYDVDEYEFDSNGNKSSSKKWSNGKLLEWFEYEYEYNGGSGKPSVATINQVNFSADYTKQSVSKIGYCAFFYDEYGSLSQESFSDDKVYLWTYNSDGTARQRETRIGVNFMELLRYEYAPAGTLVKETTYANDPMVIQEEKIYSYGTVYIQVPNN
ncbi:MAG: hypothetical protein K6E19_06405, partial [Lachnospiraceae bacterium]|nr:hypothetical protein [Lachnospiraceae bacterium]